MERYGHQIRKSLARKSKETPDVVSKWQDKPVACLGLAQRYSDALESNGIYTLGQLMTVGPKKLINYARVGETALSQIEKALEKLGLAWPGEGS